MPKIYLSPARHRPDNPCSYDKNCGENKHNEQYLDELVVFLTACGFEYKRNKPVEAGGTMQTAVAESNAWGADLHYVSHTNAFNGTVKGSRPIVYPKGKGRQWAEILLKHRAEIYPHAMKINERTDLYELNSTKATTIYEEHIFHDNYEDAKWFHENLRNQARQTCKAFCEIFNVPFVDPYVILGDIDRDNRLTVADAIALRRLIMSGGYDKIADVTKDGKLTVADIIALRHTIMNENEFDNPPNTLTPSSAPQPTKPLLKYGSNGDVVKELQMVLSRLGLYYGKVDGIFGALTLDAVRTFQRVNGLVVDGIVGQKTWDALNKKNTNINPYPIPTRLLKKGSKGQDVRWVQWHLVNKGYSIGSYGIDGVFGESTEEAVRRFQINHRLLVDGIVGEKTRSKLEE